MMMMVIAIMMVTMVMWRMVRRMSMIMLMIVMIIIIVQNFASSQTSFSDIHHTDMPLVVKEPPSSLSSHRLQKAKVPKVLLICDNSFLALGRRRGT